MCDVCVCVCVCHFEQNFRTAPAAAIERPLRAASSDTPEYSGEVSVNKSIMGELLDASLASARRGCVCVCMCVTCACM